MIKRIFYILTTLLVLALLFLAAPWFFPAEFEIVNNSRGPVSVVAAWRSNEKRIGSIEPLSSHQFSVDDEAAMTFTVLYADGRQFATEPVYFTSGMEVIATISNDGVDVRYRD